jgi:hypothetical protein
VQLDGGGELLQFKKECYPLLKLSIVAPSKMMCWFEIRFLLAFLKLCNIITKTAQMWSYIFEGQKIENTAKRVEQGHQIVYSHINGDRANYFQKSIIQTLFIRLIGWLRSSLAQKKTRLILKGFKIAVRCFGNISKPVKIVKIF